MYTDTSWHSRLQTLYFPLVLSLFITVTAYSKKPFIPCVAALESSSPASWVTDRLGGLQRARGERVPAAAALGAEVRRGRRRVVDVGQDVVVPALLLGTVRIVAI